MPPVIVPISPATTTSMSSVMGGLIAALMWGTSTIAASRSTRILGSQQALAWVLAIGLAACLPLALLEGVPRAAASGWAWALIAGLASVLGLSMLYRGLRIGKVGIVAPIVSTKGALAAVFAVALGDDLTLAVASALGVVVIGVVTVTSRGGSETCTHARSSTHWLRQPCSGLAWWRAPRAGDELGALWTILLARVVGAAILILPLVVRKAMPRPGTAWPLVTWSGLAELAGFIAYIRGAQEGIAVAAVLAAQFSAVAVVLSYLLFGERLARRQLAGVLLIMAGVTAVAALRA